MGRGLRLRVTGLGLRVQGVVGIRFKGQGSRVKGLRFQV